ncbi:DUF4160 domain-containing protein [Tangfeifania diversioriginum]|nr:DUF4160 domain-containing protein [Tangfeifania diversioriginum]
MSIFVRGMGSVCIVAYLWRNMLCSKQYKNFIINFEFVMPVVLRIKGYRFYFFSNESGEPKHIHVNKADANGKIWLEPFD